MRSEADRMLRQWIDLVRSNADALRENRASPELLLKIGMAYFYGDPQSSANIASERGLADIPDSDELVQVATAGLCSTVWRRDLPEIAEIFRLSIFRVIRPAIFTDIQPPWERGELTIIRL